MAGGGQSPTPNTKQTNKASCSAQGAEQHYMYGYYTNTQCNATSQVKAIFASGWHFGWSDPVLKQRLKAVGAPRKSTIEWLYPSVDTRKEPQGVNFVDDRQVRDQWKKFWPTSGRQQSWDGVAKLLSPGRLRNRNARTYCAAPTKCGKHQFGMSFG